MTKIDVVSGFLGAGKTTLIKKLLKEALADEQVVLIENEFGEIGIDGGFLKDAGIEIKEMNSGCICCSLVGDFGTSLKEVLSKYKPDRILIEPSGVGKLSDVVKAIKSADLGDDVVLNSAVVVIDASKTKMYVKNFGEFYVNQVEHAGTIILSRTDKMSDEKLKEAVDILREHNQTATIVTTPWNDIDGKAIEETIEGKVDLAAQLMAEYKEDHEHHHHHHEDGEECCCHDHDHDHHHHDHDEDHDEDHECHHHDHEHHHHHEDGEECCCHDHDHHHEGHHHADEIFTSRGFETPSKYSKEDIENILKALDDRDTYGFVLRAKGMVQSPEGGWVYFDYVPEESNVREGSPQPTGRFCVIGSDLKEDNLKALFGGK